MCVVSEDSRDVNLQLTSTINNIENSWKIWGSQDCERHVHKTGYDNAAVVLQTFM